MAPLMDRVSRALKDGALYLKIVQEHRWLMISFCLYSMWMATTFGGFTFRTVFVDVGSDVLLAWAPFAAIGAVNLAYAAFYKKTRTVLDKRWQRAMMVACMTTGSLFQAVWDISFVPGQPWSASEGLVFAAGVLLVAAGTMFFRIEIDRAFGWSGAQVTLATAAGGTALLLPLCLVSVALPEWVSFGASLVLPVLTALALSRETSRYQAARYYTWGADVDLPIPRAFILTSFVQGMASGLFFTLAPTVFGDGAREVLTAAELGSLVTGVLLLVAVAEVFRLDFNRIVYKVSFPLLAAGFALTGLLPDVPGLCSLVFITGSVFIDLVLWGLGAFIMKNMGVPVVWIATIPGSALYLGKATGALGLHFLFGGTVASEPRVAALAVAVALMGVSVALISEKNLKNGWGTFRLGSNETFATSEAAAVALVANEYDLTSRESEVMALYAKGMGRLEVAEALCVSEETVKTHLRGLYRKLDVHSQPGLASVLDEARSSLSDLDALNVGPSGAGDGGAPEGR